MERLSRFVDKVTTLEGPELAAFVRALRSRDGRLLSLRIHQDDAGQVKYSINQSMWTLPVGKSNV